MRTQRVCVVVCANGLGHMVRTLHIASALLMRLPQVRLTIACAAWQRPAMAEWPLFRAIAEHPRVALETIESHPRWSMDAAYYADRRLLTWHVALRDLRLDSFDLVLSDNFVETLEFSPRTVLVGSFLWHDVYSAQYPDAPVVQEYRRRCVTRLEERRPPMIANRYFAMPAVRSETECVGVGMFPPLVRPPAKSDATARRGVLLAASGPSPAAAEMRGLLRELRDHNSLLQDVPILVDARLASQMPIPARAQRFDHRYDDFSEVAAVIARPGMGTITDCISTNTGLFCLSEPSPEMEHNTTRLEALGLGWRLPDGDRVKKIVTWIDDATTRKAHIRATRSIDGGGVDEAIDAIVLHLN